MSKASVALDLDHVFTIIEDGKVSKLIGHDGKIARGYDGRQIIADPRSLTHATLTAVHLMIIEMHNLIVDELRHKCGLYDSNELWEKGRQIVVAWYQHLTYNVIIPAHIGEENAKRYRLTTDFPPRDYVAPKIYNEYASGCSRQEHFFITDDVLLRNHRWELLKRYKFRSTFFSVELARNKWKELLIGTGSQIWQVGGITNETAHHLDQTSQEYGSDLNAMDIQRGRDTKLLSYKEYLEKRFGRCFNSYDDFNWRPGAKEVAESLYDSIDDVDFYTGIFFEKFDGAPMPLVCIDLAQLQFNRIKNGDEKFYTRHFTREQIKAIESIDLSKLFCILTGTYQTLETGHLGMTEKGNPLVQCTCSSLEECGLDIRLFCGRGACPSNYY